MCLGSVNGKEEEQMPENTQRVSVGGFSFENKDEAEQAKKEIEGIRYIKTKTNMSDPEVILQVYNKMIGQKLFETAVGYSYLKDLQEYLKASKENISFVAGQGHRKSEEQRKWEMLDRLCAADAKLCGKRFFGKLFARLKFSGQNRFAQHMIGFIRKRLPFLECL